jgi:hypothetical protein
LAFELKSVSAAVAFLLDRDAAAFGELLLSLGMSGTTVGADD